MLHFKNCKKWVGVGIQKDVCELKMIAAHNFVMETNLREFIKCIKVNFERMEKEKKLK